jgi:RNA methyltransferase, TrmH family
MLNKKEAKDIQSLALKKHRDATRCFIAEGPKIVKELAQLRPTQIQKIYATNDWIAENETMPEASKAIAVSEQELQRLSFQHTANKVVAVFEQFESSIPVDDAFVLYLDTIQDPGNFGTIVRTSDWFGIKNIVCSAGCADLYNPKVVQASMASIARVNVYYDEEENWLVKQTGPVYAAVLNGKTLYE